MEPTPHAATVLTDLKHAHELIRAAIEYRETFDPATSTRTFRISATDIGQVVILPQLMNRLRVVAPSAAVEFANFSEASHGQLESGDLDVALGFIPPLESGFHCQQLFTERFVCVVRQRHPRIKRRLTLQDFESELHLMVVTSATGHALFDQTLESLGIRRRVGLRVPNFVGLAKLVASTDLLATVPERLAKVIAELAPTRILELPIRVPSYSVMQYWHARSDKDPASKWLRMLIAELFQRP